MIKLSDILKEIRQDKEQEDEKDISPIAREFPVSDDYKKYVKKFIGQKFSKNEIYALKSSVKPSSITFFECVWEWNNDRDGSNYILTLKKLKNGSKLSYTAFLTKNKIEVENKPLDEADKPSLPDPIPNNPEQSSDKKEDKPSDTEDKPVEVKKKDKIEVKISQPIENPDGDIDELKKFISKLKIGKE